MHRSTKPTGLSGDLSERSVRVVPTSTRELVRQTVVCATRSERSFSALELPKQCPKTRCIINVAQTHDAPHWIRPCQHG